MNSPQSSRAASVMLLAFPIVLLVSDALRMGTSEVSVAEMLRDVAAHRERWFAGTLVGMLGIAMSATGARALFDLSRARTPRLAAVSFVLIIVGAYSGVAVMTTDLIPWLATDARAQPGASSVVDLVFGEQVLGMFYGFASCHSLGFLLLGIALFLTSPRLRVAGIAFVVASVVFLAGRATNTDPLRFAGDVTFLVAAFLALRARGA